MSFAAEYKAIQYNSHPVKRVDDFGDASWDRLGGQLGWVVLSQGIVTLVCGART